jgi:hypothetical protein
MRVAGSGITFLNAQIFAKSSKKEFENRTPRSTKEKFERTSLFFVLVELATVRPFAGGGQSVAVWQSYLWSAIIAIAIFCL